MVKSNKQLVEDGGETEDDEAVDEADEAKPLAVVEVDVDEMGEVEGDAEWLVCWLNGKFP